MIAHSYSVTRNLRLALFFQLLVPSLYYTRVP